MLKVTRETKAVLTAAQGRVIGFVKDSEPGKASIAVPNDRAVLTPTELRELAAWCNETAADIDRTVPPRVTRAPMDTFLTAERHYRDSVMRGNR